MEAQLELGLCCLKGQAVEMDWEQAAAIVRVAADTGPAVAQVTLGACYADGKGVAQDGLEAARLFNLAAAQGASTAHVELGHLNRCRNGVPQDTAEAARLYRLAADEGCPQGQLALGRLLLEESCTSHADDPETRREGALLLAQGAQQRDEPEDAQNALKLLAYYAKKQDVAHACCVGCGKSKQLKLCGKCNIAKFCGPECAKRMWPVHRPSCKVWAVQGEMAAGLKLPEGVTFERMEYL